MTTKFAYFLYGALSFWFLSGATLIALDTFLRYGLEERLGGVLFGFLTAPAIPPAVLIALIARAVVSVHHYVKKKRAERKIYY